MSRNEDSISRLMRNRQRSRHIIRAANKQSIFTSRESPRSSSLLLIGHVDRTSIVKLGFTSFTRVLQVQNAASLLRAMRIALSRIRKFARKLLRHSAESYHEQSSPGDNFARARNSPWHQVARKRGPKRTERCANSAFE